MRKSKFSAEVKIVAIEDYLAGKQSMCPIARKLDTHWETVREWVTQYESMGASAFYLTGNKHYPAESKKQAVLEFTWPSKKNMKTGGTL